MNKSAVKRLFVRHLWQHKQAFDSQDNMSKEDVRLDCECWRQLRECMSTKQLAFMR